MANDAIQFYRPGKEVTFIATAAVTAARFVKVTATRSGGPGLSTDVAGNNIKCAHAAAGERAVGVSTRDTAQDKHGRAILLGGGVVEVEAGADIDFNEEVQVGTAGVAVPLSTGYAMGVCLADCASGGRAMILLYGSPTIDTTA